MKQPTRKMKSQVNKTIKVETSRTKKKAIKETIANEDKQHENQD